MVWVSFAECQCRGTWIFFGTLMSNWVAWVLGSTRSIWISGERSPSSGTDLCHVNVSNFTLRACIVLFMSLPGSCVSADFSVDLSVLVSFDFESWQAARAKMNIATKHFLSMSGGLI